MEKLQCPSSTQTYEQEVPKPSSPSQSRAQEVADRSLEDMLRVFQDESAGERGSWAEDREVLVLSKMASPSSYQEGHIHRNALRNKCLTLQAVHQLIGLPQPVLEVIEPLEPHKKPNKAKRMLFTESRLPGNLGQFIEAQGEEWASKVNKELNRLILQTQEGKLDPEKVFLNAIGLHIELSHFLWAAGVRPSRKALLKEFQQEAFATQLLSVDVEIVKKLLQVGFDGHALFDANAISLWKKPALCIAARGGNVTIVNALLDAGARIDVVDDLLMGPLCSAIHNRRFDIMWILLDALRKAGAKSIKESEQALRAAVSVGNIDALKALLEISVPSRFCVPGGFGFTLIQVAESCGNLDIVSTLSRFGLRPKNSNLKTAKESGHMEIVRFLQAYMKGAS